MFDHYYAVIMAGGGGTRLWPLSRRSRPKQMLRLFDERTLFETAVDRLSGLFPPERILVVTVAEQAEELMQQRPELPAENFLIEPMPRGTASVVGLAAAYLARRDPQAVMAILTADHYMGNEARFRALLESAYEVAQDGYLVTLGIEPAFPATGFGYIQQGNELGEYRGQQAYQVLRFTEKPDEGRALEMISTGDHTWNSGMFVWKVEEILGEFQRQMPVLAAALADLEAAIGSPAEGDVIARVWPGLKNETIDYGIMEGAQRVAVLPAAGLEWNDVGSWDSIFEVLQSDSQGNIVRGNDFISLDSHSSLFYSQGSDRLVVAIGVQDLVVVDTGDVLLVCRKDQAQRVRQVVDLLKKSGKPHY